MKTWIPAIAGVVALAGAILAAEPAKKSDAPAAKALTYASVVSFFKEAKLRPIQV